MVAMRLDTRKNAFVAYHTSNKESWGNNIWDYLLDA